MPQQPAAPAEAPSPPLTVDAPRSPARLLVLLDPTVVFPTVGALVIVAIWTVAFAMFHNDQRLADAGARFAAQKYRETYESHVIRALREVDLTLKILQLSHQNGGIALPALLAQGLLPPNIFTTGYTDANGRVVDATRSSAAAEIGGLSPEDRLTIRQVENGSPAGAATLQFARPLLDRSGNLDGWAFLTIEGSFFVAAYDESALGRKGALALLSSDGKVFVHRHGDILTSHGVERLPSIARGEDSDIALVRSAIDQELRYVSAARLFGYPLVAMVGISVDERMAPVIRAKQRHFWQAGALTLLTILLFGLLTYLSLLLTRSRQRSRDARLAHAKRIEHLAYHDPLTGLPNRSLFSRLLISALTDARSSGNQLAVLFLDLDRFKQINDTLGHETGDELLRQVAMRLQRCLRDGDIIARLGGDEFVILLPSLVSDQDVVQVARRVLSTCAQPFATGTHELRVTTSIGISLFPGDGEDEQTLTKNADIAMYHAKEAGKNNYQFYSAELNTHSLERLALESGLRMALLRNEFRLYYQAKRDLRTNCIVGAEALLRWEHPDLGLLCPNQFVPLAEETGLIVEIGKWVIREACRQSLAWKAQGISSLRISVNLSPRQFADEHLLDDVLRILAETGAGASDLELEITESLLMQNVDRAIAVLTKLKELGIRVAIDDFGTGYSSLSMLRQFPLDAVKIDKSFISDIHAASGPGDVALTDAIIAMGKALNLTVVAEGVELELQEIYLREKACDQYQGYYLNIPAPAEEFVTLLNSH